ncbi:hypothetical protein V6N11_054255 [Hibiscus sabdariffa]|uniref:Uncharacterized protein n=1 Tax=Hibiscus sabdariffa TaxID=183260 RepID=A0ABR2S4A3_9ROSI
MGLPGPAIYTAVTLGNDTDDGLTLYDYKDWYGSADHPQVIQPQLSEQIKHEADPQTGCSKGGVAYTIKNNIRWLVAWTNMKDEYNKVYVNIIEEDGKIDWDSYRSLLNTSSSSPVCVYKYEHVAVANIDPSSVKPLAKAALGPATV